MHWHSASIPDRAVTSGGTPTPSSGSTSATRGSRCSLRMLALNCRSGEPITAFRVASAPVPAVVGIAIHATAGVVIHFDSPALKVEGPGTLRLTGALTLRTPSGTRVATSLSMASGPFEVTLTPSGGGVTVAATLEGAVTPK